MNRFQMVLAAAKLWRMDEKNEIFLSLFHIRENLG